MGEVRVFLVRYLIDKAHMAMTITNFFGASNESKLLNFFRAMFHLISILLQNTALREKCPYSELFWSKCGKMRTRRIPDTDNF